LKIAQSLLLVLILTACQNTWIAELVTQPGEAIYRDNFSDLSSGWPQTETANGTLGYADGSYRILVESAGYDLRAVSGHAYHDVQIEVDATRLSGPLENRFGLICRFQDMDNYYFFIISSDGYYAIGKNNNGTVSLLGQEMMAFSASIRQADAPNHLRFDCIGDTLTGIVNDQPIARISDADFGGGDAGLIAGAFSESGVNISFEHFEVVKP
jgi:hypothetical protein